MTNCQRTMPLLYRRRRLDSANVTILKGVTIGRGSVVAAGAVVTKSCPPYSIIGGVPAKVLKMRFTPAEIEKHERILNI